MGRQLELEVAREKSREERIKQRDLMKTEREHRAVERELGRKITRNSYEANDRDFPEYEKNVEEDSANTSDKYVLSTSLKGHSDDSEEDVSYQPLMEKWSGSASSTNVHKKSRSGGSFANALLRVGTKSTKDSTLDKPVQRKPGRLLETAGRSLLQKRASITAPTLSSSIASSHSSFGRLKEGGSGLMSTNNTVFNSLSISSNKLSLSFGLYGGHLSVDHGGTLKQISTISEGDEEGRGSTRNIGGCFSQAISSDPMLPHVTQDDENGAIVDKSAEKRQQPCFTKKVFSNWGGEFFKKNLDYRANTNKILEKMNLTKEKQMSITSALKNSETMSSGERKKDILGSGSNLVSK